MSAEAGRLPGAADRVAAVVWFVGLPASGKTTLAEAVAGVLRARGLGVVVLDSDVLRSALAPAVGYGAGGRDRFYALVGELAALLAAQGVVVLIAATAHRRAYRDALRQRLPRFGEVWVATPREECERRDPKGLYAAARGGEIGELPGVGVPFEAPEQPLAVAAGGRDEAALAAVVAWIAGERS